MRGGSISLNARSCDSDARLARGLARAASQEGGLSTYSSCTVSRSDVMESRGNVVEVPMHIQDVKDALARNPPAATAT